MKHYHKKIHVLFIALFCTCIGFAQYSDGVFILNEGNFGRPNASVSYLKTDGTLENDIFSGQNNSTDLGDTAQSMVFEGDNTYIVMNGSNAIKVVNSVTFELVTTIEDQLKNPRTIVFYQGNGYVTNWGDPTDKKDDYVAVIDLTTNKVTKTIAVVEGPEEILQQDGKLFVAHQGGYGYGNTISVIDIATLAVSSIAVADVPSSIKIYNGSLYVLCSGKAAFTQDETIGKLFKISLADYQDKEEYTFVEKQHPGLLVIDNTDLYYVLSKNIYKMSLTATQLPTAPFITTATDKVLSPYSFNKIGNQLYLGDALDYQKSGKVFVYGEGGMLQNTYTVGPLPNGFYQNDTNTLGKKDVAIANVVLYPNPATESVYIKTLENVRMKMYDLTGRKVMDGEYNNQKISLNGLPVGIYLVETTMKSKTSTQKLVVQ